MKTKFLFLVLAIAASISTCLYASPASIPTEEDIQNAGYNTTSNVVLCCYFDFAPCNEVVLIGSHNDWYYNPDNCVKFEFLDGFEGWLLATIPWASDLTCTPVQLDNYGNFSWNYRAGGVDAWMHLGGNFADIYSTGYGDESYLGIQTAGTYVYEVSRWANYNNLCDYKQIQIDELYYTLDVKERVASIIYSSDYKDLTTITIPSTITYNGFTYKVAIAEGAFSYCTNLASVTIARDVYIGMSAFSNCSNLTSVTIENGITRLSYGVFSYCTSLTSINIPNSVTSINGSAFEGCSGLTSIEIPNSVVEIGSGAFSYCTGLTSIEIPNSVEFMREKPFLGCYLRSIIWNAKNCEINRSSPFEEQYVNSFVFGDSVDYISAHLCDGMSNVNTISIPNSVKSIGNYAFRNCSGLTSIEIPNSVTNIGYYAFENCSNLREITLSSYLTNIASCSFTGCTGLTSVDIPNSVTDIGSSAFAGCTGLTKIDIPSSVTNIGSSAFAGCGSLAITMQRETPPTLSNDAFENTDITIYVPCGTIDVYKQAWSVYTSAISYQPLEYSIVGEMNIVEAGSVTTPTNICEDQLVATAYYGYHFIQWSDGNTENPRTIELTSDTTFTAEFAIDKSGTCGDDNLLTWTFDADKKTLAISGNGSLNSNYTFGVEAPAKTVNLVVKEGVTSIGSSAFAGYTMLQHLTLGEDISTIGSSAFANCPYLLDIKAKMVLPPVIDASVFSGCGDLSGITCYIPQGSLVYYSKLDVWKEFSLIESDFADGIMDTNSDTSNLISKQIRNDQLFILRDGKTFTIQGQEVK